MSVFQIVLRVTLAVLALLVNLRMGCAGRTEPLRLRRQQYSSNDVTIPRVDFDCGKRGAGNLPKVIDGSRSWPWVVPIYDMQRRRKNGVPTRICNGALINRQWILTTGHCVAKAEELATRIGDHDLDDPYDRLSVDVEIEAVEVHPGYYSAQYMNDVALLRLPYALEIQDNIRPICLPWNGKPTGGKQALQIGWGTYSNYIDSTETDDSVLKEARMKLIRTNECAATYSKASNSPAFIRAIQKEAVVCSTPFPNEKKTCYGDSGSPLMVQSEEDVYTLIGITGYGLGCSSQVPTLFPSVTRNEILTWIQQTAF